MRPGVVHAVLGVATQGEEMSGIVERLRTEIKQWKELAAVQNDKIWKMREENEKLRETVRRMEESSLLDTEQIMELGEEVEDLDAAWDHCSWCLEKASKRADLWRALAAGALDAYAYNYLPEMERAMERIRQEMKK